MIAEFYSAHLDTLYALVGDLIYGKTSYEDNEGWYRKYDLDSIEVVGNVYDNPELIKRESAQQQ